MLRTVIKSEVHSFRFFSMFISLTADIATSSSAILLSSFIFCVGVEDAQWSKG